MKNSTLRLASFIVFLVLSLPLHSQLTPDTPGSFSIGLLHNRPGDSLALQGYAPGWGFSMDMLPAVLFKQSPLQMQLGLRFDYSQNGRFRTEMDLLEPRNGRADYRLSNQQAGIFAMSRLISRPGKVRPYVDGMAGLRVHSTVESYNLIGAYPGYEDFVSDPVLRKAAFSYGGAAGLEVRLQPGVALDFRVLYSRSGRVPFAQLEEARLIEQRVDYPVAQAPTRQMGVQIGLTFEIHDDDEPESSLSEGCCCCERNVQPRLPQLPDLPPPTDPRPIKPIIKNQR